MSQCIRVSFYVGGDEWIETKLLHRDYELRQFSLVGLDHVDVCPSYLLQLVLQLWNQVWFSIFDFLDGLTDCANCSSIYMCCLEDLVELEVLYL